MTYYSDELIEEVRSRNDVVDVISGYVRLQKRGSTYFGLCPFHNEKTPSFSVSPGKQMYYCFGCGAGGKDVYKRQGKNNGLGALTGSADTYWSKNKGRSMEGMLVKVTRVLLALFLIISAVLTIGRFQ